MLEIIGRVLDLLLDIALLNRLQCSAYCINLFEIDRRPLLNLIRQRLDVILTRQRIYRVGHARLKADDLLRAQRDPRRIFRWKTKGLVEGIRMQ